MLTPEQRTSLSETSLEYPANLYTVEGIPPEWLINRASRYFLGERTMAFQSDVRPIKPFNELTANEQLKHILEHESLGPIDEERFWHAAFVAFPYSPQHIMVVPSTADVEDLQGQGMDEHEWNSHLESLFVQGGKFVTTVNSWPDTNETIFGINAGANKSKQFFHPHFVCLKKDDWEEVSYDSIPVKIPHRQQLLQENHGYYSESNSAKDVVETLYSEFPDILSLGTHKSYIITNGASVFIPLPGTIEEITSIGSRFVDMMKRLDKLINLVQESMGVAELNRCESMVVGQMKEEEHGYLAFQLAAKIGNKPSGLLEAIQYCFSESNDYARMAEKGVAHAEEYVRNAKLLYKSLSSF